MGIFPKKWSEEKTESRQKRKKFSTRYLAILFLSILILSAAPHVQANDALAGKCKLISIERIGKLTSLSNVEILMEAAGADDHTMSPSLGGYGNMFNAREAGAAGSKIDDLKAIWKIIDKQLKAYPLIAKALKVALEYHYYPYTYKVVFYNPHSQKNESGLLAAPYKWSINPMKAHWLESPILGFQHPTQTERAQSPSLARWNDEEFTFHFANIMAMAGFIVVVPDYAGMGVNHEIHPYCLEELGYSTVAMINALKNDLKKMKHRDFTNGLHCTKDVYLMGFSEGAYATLAAAKYMQNLPATYHLKAVAGLDGPYDLAGTMRTLMMTKDTPDNVYATPYFMPYTIGAYGHKYPGTKEIQFKKAILAAPVFENETFCTRLAAMLNGENTGTEITNLMHTVQPYDGPLSITTKIFQDALKDKDSDVNKKLQENTLFLQSWSPIPGVKYYFVHNEYDDSVPVGNTKALEKAWEKHSNVKFEYFTKTEPLTKEQVGTIHGASILQAYLKGLSFLLKIKN